MRSLLALALLPLGALAQDFSWIPDELSDIVSYQEMHFSECTSFADFICHPTAASCATALCANCPKYYDTCCLQSTVAPESCFQSLVGANGGGGSPASATAAATAAATGSGGEGDGTNNGAVATGNSASATTGSGVGPAPAATATTHSGAGARPTLNAEMLLPVAMAAMFMN